MRWRRRRWYDLLLVWLRFLSFVDQTAYTPTPKSESTGEFEYDFPRQTDELRDQWQDEQRRESAMPLWIWRCRDCGKKGTIYNY